MQKDALGLYDVYGVVYTPWWKTGYGYGFIFLLLIFLGLSIFFLTRLLKKYFYRFTDFDWCQVQIGYVQQELQKAQEEQNTILYFDLMMQSFKILFSMRYKQNIMAYSPQECIDAVKEHVQNQQEEMIQFIQAATTVRFGNVADTYDIQKAVEMNKQLVHEIGLEKKKS